MTGPELLTLPKCLRDIELLEEIKNAEEGYVRSGRAGSIVLEVHFKHGVAKPPKLKVDAIYEARGVK